jgi:hypothetical protein
MKLRSPAMDILHPGLGHFSRALRIVIARRSTWQVRVKQDGKGSRGIWIMPLMIVAGKRYVES